MSDLCRYCRQDVFVCLCYDTPEQIETRARAIDSGTSERGQGRIRLADRIVDFLLAHHDGGCRQSPQNCLQRRSGASPGESNFGGTT
jgi:hypothetical protein